MIAYYTNVKYKSMEIMLTLKFITTSLRAALMQTLSMNCPLSLKYTVNAITRTCLHLVNNFTL
jgi:hypothetical protein